MWALQYAWCPYKKGKLGHSDKHRGKTRTMGKDKEQGHVQAMKRGLEEILPSQPSGEPSLPIPGFWTFGLQNFETINFCCLSFPVVVLSSISPRKLIQGILAFSYKLERFIQNNNSWFCGGGDIRLPLE